MKSAAFCAALLAACNSAPPQRDVFLPPYAEKGCWARLYERAGFQGEMRQLEGPTYIESLTGGVTLVPDIDTTPPQPLFSQIGSLVVGPRAVLVGYAEPLFARPTVELGPGAPVSDTGAIAFYERVRSLAMRCEAPPISRASAIGLS